MVTFTLPSIFYLSWINVNNFKPAFGLSNQHLQSFLSSVGPRKSLEKRRAKKLLATSETHILTTTEGFKLLGYLSKHKLPSKGVAIILHGWEGSAESSYVLSSGQHLLDQGYDVFRLNFRDHGNTHALNKDLFNFTCLQEVSDAIKHVCEKFGGSHNVICGFSLGGNFSLRVANIAKHEEIPLHQCIAICPVLSPSTTMKKLHTGLPVYQQYFVKKWKDSLCKKSRYHTHFDYLAALDKLNTLEQMNDFFILNYTSFKTTQAYFDAYSLLGNRLKGISLPTTIICAEDDPIIPACQLDELIETPWITVEKEIYGGHCAFIKNWKLESWISKRISLLVNQAHG